MSTHGCDYVTIVASILAGVHTDEPYATNSMVVTISSRSDNLSGITITPN